jgi:hypothetical protein
MSIIPLAHAAVDATKFGNVINPIATHIVYPVIELLFGVGVLYFAWGIAKMIIFANDETARSEGKKSILWGSIGMLIMISAWGIVYLISNTIKGI